MHPEIDRFAHLESVVHRWDARWKLGTLLLLMLAFGLNSPAAGQGWNPHIVPALLGLLFSIAILLASRIPIRFVARRVRPVLVFLVAMSLVLTLTYPEPNVWFGFLPVRPRGLREATFLSIRVLSIVLLVFPAFGTTRFDVTMKALRRLHVPAFLVQVVLFTYRYVFVYADEYRRMANALRARGFRLGWNRRSLRVVGSGIGVLLVGSIERTQRIQDAMKSRGFSGTFRTLDEFRTAASDVVLSVVLVAVGVSLAAWRLL